MSPISPAGRCTLPPTFTRDGRFRTEEAKGYWRNIVRGWIDFHTFDLRDLQHWMEKQTYLAVGVLLMGAAELGVDVCPM